MNFELTDEQAMLRDLVERFASDRYDPARRMHYRREPHGFSRENWSILADMGLLALPLPEDAGGIGGGAVDVMTVMEGFGRALVVEPYLGDILIGAALLAEAGTQSQREEWLGRIVGGEARIVLAHFEHEARFDECNVRTRVEAGVLHGAKAMVLAAMGADAMIVSARSGTADDPDDLSLWLVATDQPGVTTRPYRLTDGSVACEVRLLGAPGIRLAGGADALVRVLDKARVAACAEMVGLMSMLFDATLEHVRTRRQFGVAIGSFQAIQHRMADLYALLEQSRSHLYRAALSAEAERRAIPGAKSFIGASAIRLGEECIQLHGGIGTSDELAIGHAHKRILVLATLLGDPDSELVRYAKMSA